MGIGLGIYLPMTVTVPLALGGIFSFFVKRATHKRAVKTTDSDAYHRSSQERTTLIACGLVAGSSLMGVILAIPFALSHSTNVLNIMPSNLSGLATLLSVFTFIGLLYWMYRVAMRSND
jgi:uncharacterized oligopeptide transporter (OPT) family protein